MKAPTPAKASSFTQELAALAEGYWQIRLGSDPPEATLLGDHRFDDRLADRTPEGLRRETSQREALLAKLLAIDPAQLTDQDRITYRALQGELESELAVLACDLDAWAVDPMNGLHIRYMDLAQLQKPTTPEEGRALVERWRRMGPSIDDAIANVRRGLGVGKTAPAKATARVIEQLDELLAKPDAEWALMTPTRADHPDWPDTSVRALREGASEANAVSIRPAFKRYRDVLSSEVLPLARGDDRVGLSNLPGGAACYARLIKVHTSLPLSAGEIHAAGLEEIATIRGEMSALGERLFGTRDLPAIQLRLRTDPGHFFATREEVEAKASAALAKAGAAFPRWFGRVPRTACVVRRIEAYAERDSTIAYYLPPAADGSRAGTYYVNTYAPETRPRYEAEALAFHEAIPGHHSQIAIAQELGDIPVFRRHTGVTAFVEGWALYAERLADEIGLYSSDLDRIGMWSYSAWRASRLVVDTGMHAMGWSRGDAVRYMMENTLLAENNIVTEVDRYINWPGQALAYKVGEREILRLRADAKRRLGARFDIRSFHDMLLGNGAVSLGILREEVERWVAGALTSKAPSAAAVE